MQNHSSVNIPRFSAYASDHHRRPSCNSTFSRVRAPPSCRTSDRDRNDDRDLPQPCGPCDRDDDRLSRAFPPCRASPRDRRCRGEPSSCDRLSSPRVRDGARRASPRHRLRGIRRRTPSSSRTRPAKLRVTRYCIIDRKRFHYLISASRAIPSCAPNVRRVYYGPSCVHLSRRILLTFCPLHHDDAPRDTHPRPRVSFPRRPFRRSACCPAP